MKINKVAQQWMELAPHWIKESREGRNAMRVGLLDKAVIQACGCVQGLEVLDVGCGEGRFSRMLVDRGARRVLGVDLCEPMIKAASELASGKDSYSVADAQDLSFLGNGSFDLAVSYLNQSDLPNFAANSREVFRVLRPEGRFIVCNLHPMRSATGSWQRSTDGSKLHVILDRYFDEGERHWNLMGTELTNFHRTLSSYVRGYRKCGFAIEDLIEPTVDPADLVRYPELDDELRVPNFIIFVLKKENRPDYAAI